MQIPEIDYDSCPNNLGGSLRLWIEEGIECGGFVMYVLENDLRHAVFHADKESEGIIIPLVKWLHFNAPNGCWGSQQRVVTWKGHKGSNSSEYRFHFGYTAVTKKECEG